MQEGASVGPDLIVDAAAFELTLFLGRHKIVDNEIQKLQLAFLLAHRLVQLIPLISKFLLQLIHFPLGLLVLPPELFELLGLDLRLLLYVGILALVLGSHFLFLAQPLVQYLLFSPPLL